MSLIKKFFYLWKKTMYILVVNKVKNKLNNKILIQF